MRKKIRILLVVIIALAVLFSIIYLNSTKKQEEKNDKFKIVTTFYPIYIMTQNIIQGASNVEIVNMTDINIGCLHDYTLSTKDLKKIENANVIVQNGLGLESFMDKILNTYSNIKIIDSSKNINNKIEENGEINPHVWTSISNYILQVEEITNKLCEINQENSTIYIENKSIYINKLKELQSKYNKKFDMLEGKKAICLNEAITYFAKELKLDITSVHTNHEENTLSAEKMKELIKKMKEENITIILVDEQDNLKNAETLAKETGGKIYKLKSALTGKMESDSYIKDMGENFCQFGDVL